MQLETRILYSFHPELHERLRRATGAPARRGPLYARFVRVGVGDRSGDHGVPATSPGPPRRGLCAVGWDGAGGSAGAEPPGSLEAFGYKLLAPGLSRGFGSPAGPPQGHEGKTT